MACVVSLELYPVVLDFFMETNRDDFVHRIRQVAFIIQDVSVANVTDFDVVQQYVVVDRLSRVRHHDLPFEVSPPEEVRQGSSVVDVEVRHQQQVDIARIYVIKVRQRVYPVVRWVDPTVEQNVFAFELEVDAAPAYFVSSADGSDLEDVPIDFL
eukprot:CAMPEP_0168351266 /NCGR_PEP_ID=MMETSP0213-20121227/21737_1 /TAXON_ID=151035 /ORGANISM="Euplotes harpa, Strain FSP1.4" /LENGTH=154 /DNA_ID=CAMNT_0008362021 /DNA_START=312 /DNA_END=773 /DNA_ORIENTATION=-